MKKVCMVGIFTYFRDARVKGYSEALRKAGIAVDVLTKSRSAGGKLTDKNGVQIYMVKSPRARKKRIGYFLEYIISLFALGFKLTRLAFKNRYDFIHVHNMPDFLVFTCFLPKLLGANIILDMHDLMPEVYLSKYPHKKDGLGLFLIYLQENISTRFADFIITANHNFRKNLIQRGIPASKILVVRNFPDPNVFKRFKYVEENEQSNQHFTLIFPGTTAPRYGLDIAIKALPLILAKIPSTRLLIIGPINEYVDSLLRLAEQLDVLDAVDFNPPIPNEEIPKQLVQVDVGIYTALPDPHMSIATPGKLLEFAVMGIPIVSSRLEIVEDIFGEAAVMYFEPGDVDQFARCIIKLHCDPVFREELISRADIKLKNQQLAWEQEFQKYFHLLSHLSPEKLRKVRENGMEKDIAFD